ncbi:MAG TPA: MmcQ/YjbR family DNA-binding protein [Candidatus Polarisedimenticolia bacterium]|nr:MmcQ/YjbR family DNA-binding protein [Candidatus Polarisedimenticolia bacterium]
MTDDIARIGQIRAALSDAACALPETHLDFPWGERVVKVRGKVFVFLGVDEPRASAGLSLKLRDSHEEAMATPGARPTGYGLGKAGWVSIPLTAEGPPLDALQRWLLESYRIVAPKRLGALLDRG